MANKPYVDIYSGLVLEDKGTTEINTINYTATKPIQILNHNLELAIDNQLVVLNDRNELTVNLNEIGGELTEKLNVDLTNLSDDGSKYIKQLSTDKYGIKGDYATQYGVIEAPNGVVDKADDKIVIINSGIKLKCPGNQDIISLNPVDMLDITSTSDITLFYAGDTYLECGDVFYQETEPENGIHNYVAWYNPNKDTNPTGQWQFKSNDTGNVYRPAIATPIANIYMNEDRTAITRIDSIGYRILNAEMIASKMDLPKENQVLSNIPMLPTVDELIDTAELSDVINKINEIINVLKDRKVLG